MIDDTNNNHFENKQQTNQMFVFKRTVVFFNSQNSLKRLLHHVTIHAIDDVIETHTNQFRFEAEFML